jgi:uncharacterized membrane protein (DUF2068 family)
LGQFHILHFGDLSGKRSRTDVANQSASAREAFTAIGVWAIVWLCVVCIACLLSAVGLWHGRRWGHRLAVTLLAINLAGDIVNVALGTEPRAAVGIPIAAAIIVYLLSSRVREFFKTSLPMEQ